MASQPDVSQVIAGPGLLYIAPVGTAAPAATAPLVWTGWNLVGYTDAGIDVIYTPTDKEIYVDEEAAPVLDILEKEKFVVQAHLAEVSLTNLNYAISASTYTVSDTAPLVTFGSQALNYVAVGVSGPAPGGFTSRLILMQKAIANVAVSMKISRKDKQVIPVSFDGRKIAGQPLGTVQDVGAGYENS